MPIKRGLSHERGIAVPSRKAGAEPIFERNSGKRVIRRSISHRWKMAVCLKPLLEF